jgi:hypothetical protein
VKAKAVTRKQAAFILSCSERTVDTLRALGEIDEIELSEGGGVRICVDSIDAYIDRGRNARRRREGGPNVRAGSAVEVAAPLAAVKARLRERSAGRG